MVNCTIHDGSVERIYPQGSAPWLSTMFEFLTGIFNGGNMTGAISPPRGASGDAASGSGSTESEYCLLLDVMTPETIFNAGRGGNGSEVAVGRSCWAILLGWSLRVFQEGGLESFMFRLTIVCESPLSLEPQKSDDELNSGLFGFPPQMPGDRDTVSNGGLFDQRLALDWV